MVGHARYTALLDACVLYPVAVADALIPAGLAAQPEPADVMAVVPVLLVNADQEGVQTLVDQKPRDEARCTLSQDSGRA